MYRNVILNLLCSCVLGAMALPQAPTPRAATAAEAAEFERMVAGIKNLPARKLDRSLSPMGLADWLRAEVGPDTPITWTLMGEAASGTGYQPEYVEVGVHAKSGRNLFINVTVGTVLQRPHVLSVSVRDDSHHTDVQMRMRDVPGVLRQIRQESDHPLPAP